MSVVYKMRYFNRSFLCFQQANRIPERAEGDDLELAAREAALSAAAAVAASSAAVRSVAASQTWNPGKDGIRFFVKNVYILTGYESWMT